MIASQHMIPGTARLSGVAALAANDVWAVGSVTTTIVVTATNGFTSTVTLPLIEHFDGRVWCAVETHNASTDSLNAVAAVNAHDAWAVGAQIEHWDGKQWQVVVTSVPVRGGLTSVSASSATNAWAAGNGLIERWDGTRWQEVPPPDTLWLTSRSEGAATIATRSASDTWLVTQSRPLNGPGLLSHWNGQGWQDFARPPGAKQWEDIGLPRAVPPTSYSSSLMVACDPLNAYVFDLNAVVVLARDEVWIAGSLNIGHTTCPLLYRWDGTRLHEVWAATTPRDVGLFEQAAIRTCGGTGCEVGWSLTAMAAAGPADIWAMTGLENHALHWDGRRWQVVANLGFTVTAMSVVNGTDIWAMGSSQAPPGSGYHWDGRHWQPVSMQPAG